MTTAHDAMLDAATKMSALTDYIDEQYAADLARYQQLQDDVTGLMSQTFYVDQATGDDANSGNEANPLASIDEATERSLTGGGLVVILVSDYHVSTRIGVKQGFLRLRSNFDAVIKPVLTFADRLNDESIHQPGFRRSGGHAEIHFLDLEVVLPVLAAHVSVIGMIDASGFLTLQLEDCEMIVDVGANMALIKSSGNVSLYVKNTVVPAEMAGLWIRGVVAGTVAQATSQYRANIAL